MGAGKLNLIAGHGHLGADGAQSRMVRGRHIRRQRHCRAESIAELDRRFRLQPDHEAKFAQGRFTKRAGVQLARLDAGGFQFELRGIERGRFAAPGGSARCFGEFPPVGDLARAEFELRVEGGKLHGGEFRLQRDRALELPVLGFGHGEFGAG